MCITYFGGRKDKFESSASILDGVPENSSDLERGAAPQSIGEVCVGVSHQGLESRYDTPNLTVFHTSGAHIGSATRLPSWVRIPKTAPVSEKMGPRTPYYAPIATPMH